MSEQEPQSPPIVSHEIKLRKRASTSDYYDGYIAGLRAAREAIERHLALAIETKAVDNGMAQEEKPPG